MNNDEHPSDDYQTNSPNALAGPSTLSPSNPIPGPSIIPSDLPPLFLPPPTPPAPPAYLKSTQDLLSRFQLLPAYDKYVRPYVTPTLDNAADYAPVVDKGKGKEREREPISTSPAAQTPGGDGPDGDDEESGGHGEKRKKNNYKHLIKGVPGKHSMKKDDYLTTIMQVPPKQRIPITQFDGKTQREAFTVSLEGLKGWNPNALILESAQAREDRKKRKELKKLAKAQGLVPAASASTPAPPSTPSAASHPHAATTTTASNVMTPSSTIATPNTKASIPRPTSRPTVPPVQVAPPVRVGTPSGKTPITATPTTASGSVNGITVDRRGKKRDFEEVRGTAVGQGGSTSSGVPVKGNVNGTESGVGNAPKAVVNAKAGIAGARPRPIKKQRMDIQGRARDVTVTVQQQPTPQGV